MEIRKIDDNISVAPQIAVQDVAEIARLGFKTLVANRPDREEPGNITDGDVDNLAPMIRDADKPVFAFCRSGTRCTVLWALSAARELDPREILTRAHRAGYDITGLIPRLQQQADQH